MVSGSVLVARSSSVDDPVVSVVPSALSSSNEVVVLELLVVGRSEGVVVDVSSVSPSGSGDDWVMLVASGVLVLTGVVSSSNASTTVMACEMVDAVRVGLL